MLTAAQQSWVDDYDGKSRYIVTVDRDLCMKRAIAQFHAGNGSKDTITMNGKSLIETNFIGQVAEVGF